MRKFTRGHIDDRAPAAGIRAVGALHHFTRAAALRPDLGETHNNLGTALSAKGRVDEAIEKFAEAARVSPQDPRFRINLANTLANAGRFDEAGSLYETLLEELPDDAALLNNYGVTLDRRGRRDEAIVQFRRALAIAPHLEAARAQLAIALGEQPVPPHRGLPPSSPPGASTTP